MSSNWKGAGGFIYEQKIRNKLKLNSLLIEEKFDNEDAIISYNGIITRLEIKSNKNAIFGQIKLNYSSHGWVINDKTRNAYPNTVSLLENHYGVLEKVNSHFGKPTGNYRKDLSVGNLSFKVPGVDAIKNFYHLDKDTHYIQIGGSGFYTLGEDVLTLKSTPFHGNTVIRARYKKYRKDYYGAVINFSVRDLKNSSHDLDSHI